jgi:hypothetical protein
LKYTIFARGAPETIATLTSPIVLFPIVVGTRLFETHVSTGERLHPVQVWVTQTPRVVRLGAAPVRLAGRRVKRWSSLADSRITAIIVRGLITGAVIEVIPVTRIIEVPIVRLPHVIAFLRPHFPQPTGFGPVLFQRPKRGSAINFH